MFRNATPQSVSAASRRLFFIAALTFVTALGLWLWGHHQSAAASALSSAPSCTSIGQHDCIATVYVTSEGQSITTNRNGRGDCIDIHMLAVLFPDGHTDNLKISTNPIPSPEFDHGQSLIATPR